MSSPTNAPPHDGIIRADNSQPADEELILLDILKTYYELCRTGEDRAPLVEDASLQKTLADYVLEKRPKVLLYVVKILLLLTESGANALRLSQNAQLKANIWVACEMNIQPKVTRNLLKVHSRMAMAIPRPTAAPRKIFRKTSHKQYVFSFESLDEVHRRKIEFSCISAPGVVSICFQDNKCILRCKDNVEGKDVAKRLLSSSGFDVVSMLVTLDDGSQETFDFYAENQLDKSSDLALAEEKLPRYLDDYGEEFDPQSCVVSKEQLEREKEGGLHSWFSSLRFW